jgi:hypothetical protein
MALVTRYFDVTGAGAADGTSYANRAPLFVTGNLNSIIRGFSFAADALDCICEPGTYTQSVTVNAASFTSGTPSRPRRLMIRTAGWSQLGWKSPQPFAGLWNNAVRINCSTAGVGWSGTGWDAFFQGVYFNWNSSAELIGNCQFEMLDCYLHQAGSGRLFGSNSLTANNCVFHNSNTTATVSMANIGSNLANCRIEMNLAGASTNILSNPNSGSSGGWQDCTFVGPGIGIKHSISNPNFPSVFIDRCTFHVGADAIFLTDTATNIQSQRCTRSFISSGGQGIKFYDTRCFIWDNVIRCTGTPINAISTNIPSNLNIIPTAAFDTTHFVDAANGDYRIKYGSAYWGKDIGAGDGPIPVSPKSFVC